MAVPPELHVLHSAMRAANHKTCCTEWATNVRPSQCQTACAATQGIRLRISVNALHLNSLELHCYHLLTSHKSLSSNEKEQKKFSLQFPAMNSITNNSMYKCSACVCFSSDLESIPIGSCKCINTVDYLDLLIKSDITLEIRIWS